MKNVMCKTIFCVSFVSAIFGAESPEKSSFVTRGVDLGDTGTARPQRANSLQRAPTIRVTLPRRTSSGEGEEKKALYKSPRDESMGVSLTSLKKKEFYGLSKAPESKIVSSSAEKK